MILQSLLFGDKTFMYRPKSRLSIEKSHVMPRRIIQIAFDLSIDKRGDESFVRERSTFDWALLAKRRRTHNPRVGFVMTREFVPTGKHEAVDAWLHPFQDRNA